MLSKSILIRGGKQMLKASEGRKLQLIWQLSTMSQKGLSIQVAYFDCTMFGIRTIHKYKLYQDTYQKLIKRYIHLNYTKSL